MESDANSSSSGGGGEKTPHYNCYYRNTHPLPHALLRHTTSPPLPFFSQFHSHHGNGNGDLTPSSIRLMSHTSFLSGSVAPSLSEVEHENGAKVGNPNSMGGNDSIFTSGFPMGSWNDSTHFAENFAIKREPNNDHKLLGASEKLPGGISRPALYHRLSLPKSTPEMLAMEKLLQLQDTVPCKIRAKRGCATHPRSIAERVRRTRISERMRKLQELVPNMDKQTNTADMLDLAVDYIKNLQKQYAALNDSRTKCKCSASHSLSR